jgi:hypothetical protein
MTTPTKEDRLEFWKFAYARASFVDAKHFLELLLDPDLEDSSPVRKALSIAASIVYARPFKQRNQVRLPDEIVPKQHKDAHDSVIDIRDTVIAHRDIDAPEADCGPINQLRVNVQSRKLTVQTVSPFMSVRNARLVYNLVCEMIKKMNYHIRKHVKRDVMKVTQSDGTYILSLEDDPEEWLRKSIE